MSNSSLSRALRARKVRGAALAAAGLVREDWFGWKVRSQVGLHEYTVTGTDSFYACNCRGYTEHRYLCAHTYAVALFCRAQARAVRARSAGELVALYHATRLRMAGADPYVFDVLTVLLFALIAEGHDLLPSGDTAPFSTITPLSIPRSISTFQPALAGKGGA